MCECECALGDMGFLVVISASPSLVYIEPSFRIASSLVILGAIFSDVVEEDIPSVVLVCVVE